jgi:hypothetical protein
MIDIILFILLEACILAAIAWLSGRLVPATATAWMRGKLAIAIKSIRIAVDWLAHRSLVICRGKVLQSRLVGTGSKRAKFVRRAVPNGRSTMGVRKSWSHD